jgi:hypothetical protein
MINSIDNITDVLQFTSDLVTLDVNFHPDTDFDDYINVNTSERTFSFEDAKKLNKLLIRAFEVCAEENIDIYDLTMPVLLESTGLHQIMEVY